MEPITTTAMIATVVGYLAKTLKDNKSIEAFFNQFTEATVNWIRPIFLKEDDQPKEVLESLQQNPESAPRQKAAETALEIALEDMPHAEALLRDMYQLLKNKEVQGEVIHIVGSKNVVSGSNISAGGDVHIGDKTQSAERLYNAEKIYNIDKIDKADFS